jgi:hypothetical protein
MGSLWIIRETVPSEAAQVKNLTHLQQVAANTFDNAELDRHRDRNAILFAYSRDHWLSRATPLNYFLGFLRPKIVTLNP